MSKKVKMGLSLYSLTNEYYHGLMTTEDCIKAVKYDLGLEGAEILGAQMFKGYPWPTDKTIYSIRELFDKHGLELFCYAAQSDCGKRSDRLDLSDKELLNLAVQDCIVAHKLGAPVIRQQMNITPEVFEQLAPYAEFYNVKVGIEVHPPLMPSGSEIARFIDVIERTGSKYIGFVPDSAIFSESMQSLQLGGTLSNLSVRQEIQDYLASAAAIGIPFESVKRDIEKYELNAIERASIQGYFDFFSFGINQKPDVKGLRKIMPYTFDVHEKLNALNEEYDDIVINNRDFINVVKESDYDGYIMIEYDGHQGNNEPALPLIKKHLEFCNKILAEIS